MKKSRIFFITCCILLVLLFGLCSVAYADDAAAEEPAFEEALYQLLKEKPAEPVLNVEAYGFYFDPVTQRCDALSAAYTSVMNNHPDLFYASGAYQFDFYPDDGDEDQNDGDYLLANIYPEYVDYINHEDLDEIVAAFDEKVDEVFYSIWDPDMSDEEAALAFHDWLVLNCEYDWDNYVAGTVPDESYSAYGTFMNGTSVCQGYALAYDLLLGKAGIETRYVTSDAMDHGWSLVHIGDHWYHVDVTWDDPVADRPGLVSHDYFLVSGAQFAKQNVDSNPSYYDHYGWDPAFDLLCSHDGEACDDATYRNSKYPYIHSEDSPFHYVDGKFWYYLNDKDDTWESHPDPVLASSNFDGSDVKYYIPDEKYREDSIIWDLIERDRIFTGLVYDDGNFYFTSNPHFIYFEKPSYILKYNIKEGTFTEVYNCGGGDYTITGLAIDRSGNQTFLKYQHLDWTKVGNSYYPGDTYWSDPINIGTMASGEVDAEGTLNLTVDPHFFQPNTVYALAAVYDDNGFLIDLVRLPLDEITELHEKGLHGKIHVRIFEMAGESYAPQTDADPIDFDID